MPRLDSAATPLPPEVSGRLFFLEGGGGLDIVEMKSSQYFFRTEFVSLLVGWRGKPIGRRTYSSVLLMKTQHFEPQVKTHAK